jgi:hypothetical protein
MIDIASISGTNATPPASRVQALAGRAGVSASEAAGGAVGARGVDRAELSPIAGYVARLRDLPVREELVVRVRGELRSGTYESAAKIEAALDEVGKDLAGGPLL